MDAVFLDYATVDMGDLDPAPLRGTVARLTLHEDTAPADVRARLAGAQVAIVNKIRLDAECVAALPELRLICLVATGTDNVDLAACRERGIAVCNLRDYCTDSVAQHVLAVLLTLARRLDRYRALVRDGDWTRSDQFCLLDAPIMDLNDLTLGVIGYGVLGSAVAHHCRLLGMRVLIAARADKAPGESRVVLDTVLAQADVLTIHCPLTEQTRGLIDAEAIAKMKPGALLINTARGAIVDSEALADALRSGRLGGAALDVLPKEPPPADEPLLAPDIPNLLLTPHVAWASRRARQHALEEIARNIEAFRAGRERHRVA